MSVRKYTKIREAKRSLHRNCGYQECAKPAKVSAFRKDLGITVVYCRDHAVMGGLVDAS